VYKGAPEKLRLPGMLAFVLWLYCLILCRNVRWLLTAHEK
jgi:hypothetical protein